MVDRIRAAGLDKVIAALPDAVDQALRKAVPGSYTTETATAITSHMIARLRARRASHYPWCEPGACIAHEADGETWVEHLGAEHQTELADHGDRPVHLVAQVGFNPELEDAPQVHLWEAKGNVSILDETHLGLAIERLETLVGTLRTVHGQLAAARTGVTA
jgi:hypothetical protein